MLSESSGDRREEFNHHDPNKAHPSYQRAIQSGVRPLTCLSVITLLFFSGYWLGWKATVAKTQLESPNKPAEVPAAAPSMSQDRGITRRSPARMKVKERHERAAKIAHLMHADPMRARIEIASFTIDEVQSTVLALEDAPETRLLDSLRSRLLERWASLEPRTAFDYARGFSWNQESESLPKVVLRRLAFFDVGRVAGLA